MTCYAVSVPTGVVMSVEFLPSVHPVTSQWNEVCISVHCEWQPRVTEGVPCAVIVETASCPLYNT